MRILFVHQNYPGQFMHLAPALANDPRNEIVAFTMNNYVGDNRVRMVRYQPLRGSSPNMHPWLSDFETKVIRSEAAFRAAVKLKQQGFSPDVIVAHPGWGESLFLKDVWPNAKLGIYCEFFYHVEGADVGFDPEFGALDPTECCRIRLKNINNLIHFEQADAGISPTSWQASTFPEPFRSRITVVHDGIDTDVVVPNPRASANLSNGLNLSRKDELITFVNRNLEPYRGYHIFMRALPEILRRRPRARVLIVGGNEVSYGAPPPLGKTWKNIFLSEVSDRLADDAMKRIFFLGNIPYPAFLTLLQLSTVHVYLTYPFVLSWSLLEAMSAGCAVVASNTKPLHEAIRHGETGCLVDFFDIKGLVGAVVDLLQDEERRVFLGANARQFACEHYALRTKCLPQQLDWVQRLGTGSS